LDDNYKINADLVNQYKINLEQEMKKTETESNAKQDVEMLLSRTKADWAIIQEDAEALVELLGDVAEKYTKKKVNIKESFAKLRNDKLKTMLLERLNASGVKHDV